MKVVFSALFISLSTLLGKEIANRIEKKERFFNEYLDFLSELLFAVRYSKETVASVRKRFEIDKYKKLIDGDENKAIELFLFNVGKSDRDTEAIRIIAERERIEKLLEKSFAKSSEKKKCAVIVGMFVGIVASIIIM